MTFARRIVPLLLFVAAAGHALGQEIVAEFTGNGLSNTRPFTVRNGWEIQWSANGEIFQVYVFDLAGELVGVAANQMGPGSGTSFNARGGTYYLQVNAMGSWAVRVVQLPAGSASQVTATLELEGDGTQNTRPFNVAGPWEIRWTADGDLFQVYVFSADGELIGVAANQMGAGGGSSFQPRGGDYYLQVNAMGAWSLRIVPLD